MKHIRELPQNKEPIWLSEYLENEGLPAEDQKWIWNNVLHISSKEEENHNVIVNGSVNGTYKNELNTEITFSKHKVITRLNDCNYRTSPKTTASLLDKLFYGWGTKDGHWLYVAQHWPPRAINRTIAQMINQYKRGECTIKNPAAYFTATIGRRKKRKCFRSTNDTYKR